MFCVLQRTDISTIRKLLDDFVRLYFSPSVTNRKILHLYQDSDKNLHQTVFILKKETHELGGNRLRLEAVQGPARFLFYFRIKSDKIREFSIRTVDYSQNLKRK